VRYSQTPLPDVEQASAATPLRWSLVVIIRRFAGAHVEWNF
jgi:hypothetical protein